MWNTAAMFATGAVGGFVGTAAANKVISTSPQVQLTDAQHLTKHTLERAVSKGFEAAEVTYASDYRRAQLKRFPALKRYDLPDWFISELLWLPDRKMTTPSEYRHFTVLVNGMRSADELAAVDALATHFKLEGDAP